MIAVQYLEPGPETANISPAQAAERLQAAFDHLPIDLVILGWNLPPALLEACAQVTQQGHARFI